MAVSKRTGILALAEHVLPELIGMRCSWSSTKPGALVAGALPGSPVVVDLDGGSGEPLPELPVRLRTLAKRALVRVVGGSGLAVGWVDRAGAGGGRRRGRSSTLL
ncbi:hypothetical protein ACQF4J_00010 [Streptomyces sp. C1-1]|uniref:hypothetical protein n=1 Tax=Streptomyces sp. C1-1 TaxID=3231173 RepID=UPI003CFF27E5